MKIKYNLEYNYFDLYNEAQGVINFKQSVYKNEYKPIKSYTANGLSLVKYTLIIFLILLLLMFINKTWLLTKIIGFIFAASFAITFIYYIIFIIFYNTEKMRCHHGELTINKNGILDTTDDGIRIGLPWHLIEALIITDKVLIFTSKTMTFYFIESSHVDEVKEAIKTYQSALKIIDKRMHKPVIIDESADKEATLVVTEEIKEEEKKENLKEVKEEIKKELEEDKDTEVEDKIKELEGN